MKDILLLFNPWWKTGKVKEDLAKHFERELLSKIINYISSKQIIALFGLRRTGKSTLFFQTIEHLIKKGIKPEHLLYFSFDQKVAEVKEILKVYTELHSLDLENGKYFVFFDEIQKLDDWQNKLKIFYDLYPNIKFFISGSSYLTLTKNIAESLAGRINFLKLEPLSFNEWLLLNGIRIEEKKIILHESELKNHFKWYLKTPFPEIAILRDELSAKKYIHEFIISRVLSYDIKKEFKDVDIELLETLKDIFFEEGGIILNIDNLAKDLKRGKETLGKHINYLAQGLLIRIVKNYRGSALSSSRKLRKVYPYHPCFCLNLDESKVIENLFIALFDAKYYWREHEKEIDIIKNKKPIEVKYKETIKNEDLTNLHYFMEKFKQTSAVVITKDTEQGIKAKNHLIKLVPAWKTALMPSLVE
ncbi:ATP-binding protein [Candidatus Woesearchaeota archaeon]|nr:ATP-binding protein [Candidatus Woesearchaeota archaeon]